jgi:hypothetical protein
MLEVSSVVTVVWIDALDRDEDADDVEDEDVDVEDRIGFTA